MLGLPGSRVDPICAMIFLQLLVDRLLGLPVTEGCGRRRSLRREPGGQRPIKITCAVGWRRMKRRSARIRFHAKTAPFSRSGGGRRIVVRLPFDPARAGEKVEILRFASTAWRLGAATIQNRGISPDLRACRAYP